MKKVLFMMLAAAVLVLAGCGNTNKSINLAMLKTQIKNEQKDLPSEIEGIGQMTKMELLEEDNMLLFECEVTNPEIDVDKLKANEEYMKRAILRGLGSADSDPILEECLAAGVGIKYVYVSSITGSKATAIITCEELKAYTEKPVKDTPLDAMKDMAAMTKSQLPDRVDENTIMTDAFLEDNNFIMIFEFDEEDGFITGMNVEYAKQAVLENLKSSNNSIGEKQLKTCKQAQFNLIYRYVGAKSHKQVDIVIKHTEL